MSNIEPPASTRLASEPASASDLPIEAPSIDVLTPKDTPDGDGEVPSVRAEKPYDPAKDREHARRNITYVLMSLLAVLLLIPMISIIASWASFQELEPLLSLAVGGVLSLVSGAVGFYFGSETGQRP